MLSPNQLIIRGSGPQLTRLLEALEQPRTGGWRRYVEAEARMRARASSSRDTLCFACTAEGPRPAAAVWLEPRFEGELQIADIVGLGQRPISDDECNLILEDFNAQVLQPACEGVLVQTEVTPNRVTLESRLSLEAVRRLKAFSDVANKSSQRPEDCQRWQQFILQTHLEGTYIDPALLDQWLTEQGWPEEQRQHLLGEYDTARSILAAYDEERLAKCLP